MSDTLTQDGKTLTETQEGVTMPADYSFATIKDFVHRADASYEDLQALCLGIACRIEKMNSIKTDND